MPLFREASLHEALRSQIRDLMKEVRQEERNQLLNANETKYLDYLTNKYCIEPLVIHTGAIETTEDEVPDGMGGTAQVFTFRVPFSGERDLLKYSPSRSEILNREVSVSADFLVFSIPCRNETPEQIALWRDATIKQLQTQEGHIRDDVERFNGNLPGEAKRIVSERKAEVLKQAKLAAALGVSIGKAKAPPKTFAVPAVAKKTIVKPAAPTTPFAPEPRLEDSTYGDILQAIWDVGREMERHKRVYAGQPEEQLRDYFLMTLTPNFDSTTGETFNKDGKTDLLVRYEGKNLFVGEFKFWKGAQTLHDAISQLLRYLTWRDSKAALIMFVKNEGMKGVLDQIQPEAAKHSCFVKNLGAKEEGWYPFEFHLPSDDTRPVKVTVLCFHLPEC